MITVTYPDLPITERREELLTVIRDHQVVVVAGETGSGKSTQLPKLCLELGRGQAGLIGHTQPRRIAARTIAERIAEELGTTLGDLVGFTVRFTDQVGSDTRVKVMTDGILLNETHRDRLLSKYDTIIIDEAHERSLNIDFLLGYLKTILPKRPDLKVIITSATIDTERFSEHFDGAPVVEVSGRTYPVEVRYRPLDDPTGTRYGTSLRESVRRSRSYLAKAMATSSCSAPENAKYVTPWRHLTSCACHTRKSSPCSVGCPLPSSIACFNHTPVGEWLSPRTLRRHR